MYDTGWNQNENVEKYGLETLHSPKHVKELSAFEKDLIAVVKNIKFRNARGYFQTALQEDTRLIFFFSLSKIIKRTSKTTQQTD